MTRSRPANRFNFQPTPIAGLMVVERKPIEDHRGFFSRFFCNEEFREAGFIRSIAQINHTWTRKRGTVRGLHFQYPPHAEIKIVSCIEGEVFDVAVDIRRNSSTFLRWHGEILSSSNQRSLLIPEGFAHGFQTLTQGSQLIYLHSTPYSAQAEGALNVADPAIGIAWPLRFADISEQDSSRPFVGAGFHGVTL
jgi:dTDP-4-dehydrorhamnose 3,5-epimerase